MTDPRDTLGRQKICLKELKADVLHRWLVESLASGILSELQRNDLTETTVQGICTDVPRNYQVQPKKKHDSFH